MRGRYIWEEFVQATGIDRANSVGLFDHHDAVDTMNRYEAIEVGVALNAAVGIRNLICSYGKRHRFRATDTRTDWYPFIQEMEGMIFTDYRQARYPHIDQVILVHHNRSSTSRRQTCLMCFHKLRCEPISIWT